MSMPDSQWLNRMTLFFPALLAFLFPLAYSPGPGNMFFATQGPRFGFTATLTANIGYHIATLFVAGLIGAGLLSVLNPGSWLFSVLKTAGSFYVLWLAWKMLWAGKVNAATDHAGRAGFVDGVLLLCLNPKAYVIIILMFSQFSTARSEGMIVQVALISLVFTLNNFVAFVTWTLAGEVLGRLFRSEIGSCWLNKFFATLLATIAVWMLLV